MKENRERMLSAATSLAEGHGWDNLREMFKEEPLTTEELNLYSSYMFIQEGKQGTPSNKELMEQMGGDISRKQVGKLRNGVRIKLGKKAGW